jgi:hypothetical protein
MFTHKHPEMDDHQHATVDEAKACEFYANEAWWEAAIRRNRKAGLALRHYEFEHLIYS